MNLSLPNSDYIAKVAQGNNSHRLNRMISWTIVLSMFTLTGVVVPKIAIELYFIAEWISSGMAIDFSFDGDAYNTGERIDLCCSIIGQTILLFARFSSSGKLKAILAASSISILWIGFVCFVRGAAKSPTIGGPFDIWLINVPFLIASLITMGAVIIAFYRKQASTTKFTSKT